jgi:hypothetical protein
MIPGLDVRDPITSVLVSRRPGAAGALMSRWHEGYCKACSRGVKATDERGLPRELLLAGCAVACWMLTGAGGGGSLARRSWLAWRCEARRREVKWTDARCLLLERWLAGCAVARRLCACGGGGVLTERERPLGARFRRCDERERLRRTEERERFEESLDESLSQFGGSSTESGLKDTSMVWVRKDGQLSKNCSEQA